ncbi:hypothetical protein [Pseudomonas maumuensis]|uniref:Uncharacterized protein n=1 Tax=Pseudomonas maumuensis TaxID=2842354 RepID=A0ABX8NQT9_9PSED|nr:hypothetical protein [Pseudomonas maumuensis]QXH58424.1 hypothetical protein KSS90_09565 [Pseudomonas maumuensis]
MNRLTAMPLASAQSAPISQPVHVARDAAHFQTLLVEQVPGAPEHAQVYTAAQQQRLQVLDMAMDLLNDTLKVEVDS